MNSTPQHPGELPRCTDMVETMRMRARFFPDLIVHTYLHDGESDEDNLTYSQLDRDARAGAAWLQERAKPGDRVLLILDPGLDYLRGLFACIYAGMTPVPAFPPDPMRADRTLERLKVIAEDCQPQAIFGTPEGLRIARGLISAWPTRVHTASSQQWLTGDADQWQHPELTGHELALLQYTSGSTSNPRGVMVSHRNIIYQASEMFFWDYIGKVGVSWLPFYHDMGMIGAIMGPIHNGCRIVSMSPLAFVQRPQRWLDAVSKYGAYCTGGPNFALELCIRKFRPEESPGLDLSSWRLAVIGAEPIRADTLERFEKAFAPFGFRPDVWVPSYGMAEATLGVSRPEPYTMRQTHDFAVADLEKGKARVSDATDQAKRRLVGCGKTFAGTTALMVDPDTRCEVPPGHVGEIWLQGPGIARGYWNRTEDTRDLFQATLANEDRGQFLRTGDLGFWYEGQIYLTGRMKEMLIYQGRNLYPYDIEATVQRTHNLLKVDGGAAFAIDRDDRERLIVVQEVQNHTRLDLDELAQKLQLAVLEDHGVPLYALLLLKPGQLPKTSSGKVQRAEIRRRYVAGDLTGLKEWVWKDEFTPRAADAPPLTSDEIRDWLRARIAAKCQIEVDTIDVDAPLGQYIHDSTTLFSLALETQTWMGRAFPPEVILDAPSLAELSRRLVDPEAYLRSLPVAPDAPLALVATNPLSEEELDQALERELALASAGEPVSSQEVVSARVD